MISLAEFNCFRVSLNQANQEVSSMADRYKTINELSAELRVSYSAVWDAIQSGRLDALQLGGAHSAIRIPAKSYREYLSKCRKSTDAAEPQSSNDVTKTG